MKTIITRSISLFVLLCLCLGYFSPVEAEDGGFPWQETGGGVGGRVAVGRPFVTAVLPDGDGLYVGGKFTKFSPQHLGYSALLVEDTWLSLGAGLPYTVNATAMDMADPENPIFYAGHAGGIAMFKNGAWQEMGSVKYWRVNALAVGKDSQVYAGGSFTMPIPGDTTITNVARWDGSDWHPMNTGLPGEVLTLMFLPDGRLAAGGTFGVALWDGTNWMSLTPSFSGLAVAALAFDGTYLYAGGQFGGINGQWMTNLARTIPDVGIWEDLGDHYLGAADYVQALAYDPIDRPFTPGGALWVGGDFSDRLKLLDSMGNWQDLPGYQPNNALYTINILPDPTNTVVFLGGAFTTLLSEAEAVSGPISYFAKISIDESGVVAFDADNRFDSSVTSISIDPDTMLLFAGGTFQYRGGDPANNIGYWGGGTWDTLAGGVKVDFNKSVNALALDPATGNLYVGGKFTQVGLDMETPLEVSNLAMWDGTKWHAVGGGVDYEVYALAFGPDGNLYVGGSFTTANDGTGDVPASNIARWDGSQWDDLAGGVDSDVYALHFGPDGTLYVGGAFNSAELDLGTPVSADYIAAWDGTHWSALGSGMDDFVYAITTGPDGNLYAGGWFYEAGGEDAMYAAMWDGTGWSALGEGLNSIVYTLAADEHGVWAGGEFTLAGGEPAGSLAYWGENGWETPLPGFDNVVNSLAIYEYFLFAGGEFVSSGTHSLLGTAMADITPMSAPTAPIVTISDANWTNAASVQIFLSGSTDPDGDFDRYQYSKDGVTAWTDINGGALDVTEEGENCYFFRAVDQAGNSSELSQGCAKIDRTAPDIRELKAGNNPGLQDGVCQTVLTSAIFTWSDATDSLSGMSAFTGVYFGPDPNGIGPSSEVYGMYHTLINRPGLSYFRVQVRDNAGNAAEWKTLFTNCYGSPYPLYLPVINN